MNNSFRKVLVVEDDAFFREPLVRKLQEHGFEVFEASDGNEGLEQLKKVIPDIIILDIIMPNKNGFEFLEEVETDPVFRAIPVFIYSNLTQESDHTKAKNIGASRVMVKNQTSIQSAVDHIVDFFDASTK